MQPNFIYSCKMKFLIICTTLFFSAEASNLPSYISQCCATDPDAEECYLSQAKLIIPIILRGDKTYNLMKLSPYMQAQMTLYDCDAGKFVLNTFRFWGLDTINVESVYINFDIGKYKGSYYFDKLKFEFTYNIDMKDTPLVGYGRGNIAFFGVNLTQTFDSSVRDKDGYVFFSNSAVTFTATNIVYNLENLCEFAEEYLQDNFEQLNEMFQPSIRRIFSAVMTSPFRALSELIKLQTGVGFGKSCKKCS